MVWAGAVSAHLERWLLAGWLKSLQCSDAVNLASVRSSVVQPLLQLIKILLMNIIIKVYFNCCMSSRFDVELVR